MGNILLIYYHRYPFPLRKSIEDHLYSFRRYSGHRCFYVNLAVRRIPRWLLRQRFDLVVFHTTFLCGRWNTALFESLCRRALPLKDLEARKVALPQDEFYNAQPLCDFIRALGIDCVFSVAPASEWAKIYSNLDADGVKFVQVLTGYLDEETVARVDALRRRGVERTIDIGYRAWQAEPWLGRHGILKTQIAEVCQAKAERAGLVTDISNRPEDTFLGNDWYKFLLRCKYIIGVEGGASVLDRDGAVRKAADAYAAEHPGASFEEIEANCFPGMDGQLQLFTLSPRHLEACAARTCQVLVEGRYNDVLQPGKHYIELKRDFSNIDDVIEMIRDDTLRDRIVGATREDIVDSGQYTYRSFVRHVLAESLGGAPQQAVGGRIAYTRARAGDALCWLIVACYCRLRSVLRFLKLEKTLRVLLGRG